MDIFNLQDYFKGWFIGNFEPSLLKSDDFEIGIKKYKAGEYEEKHLHKIATEYTVIVSGKVEMNGKEYNSDDIIVIKPNESTDFKVLEDSVTVVVKTPCVKNDKYLCS
jgi:quercetin dioxygenase-like cupin family protein